MRLCTSECAACPEWGGAQGQGITAADRPPAPTHVFTELSPAEYTAGKAAAVNTDCCFGGTGSPYMTAAAAAIGSGCFANAVGAVGLVCSSAGQLPAFVRVPQHRAYCSCNHFWSNFLPPDEILAVPDSITTSTTFLAGAVHLCKLRAAVCLFVCVRVCVSLQCISS